MKTSRDIPQGGRRHRPLKLKMHGSKNRRAPATGDPVESLRRELNEIAPHIVELARIRLDERALSVRDRPLDVRGKGSGSTSGGRDARSYACASKRSTRWREGALVTALTFVLVPLFGFFVRRVFVSSSWLENAQTSIRAWPHISPCLYIETCPLTRKNPNPSRKPARANVKSKAA